MLYFSVFSMLKYDNLPGHLTMSIVMLVSCLVSALGIVAPVAVVVVVDTYQLTQSLESRRRDNRSHLSSEREREPQSSPNRSQRQQTGVHLVRTVRNNCSVLLGDLLK